MFVVEAGQLLNEMGIEKSPYFQTNFHFYVTVCTFIPDFSINPPGEAWVFIFKEKFLTNMGMDFRNSLKIMLVLYN